MTPILKSLFSIACIETCADYPLILTKFNSFDQYFLLRVHLACKAIALHIQYTTRSHT